MCYSNYINQPFHRITLHQSFNRSSTRALNVCDSIAVGMNQSHAVGVHTLLASVSFPSLTATVATVEKSSIDFDIDSYIVFLA